MYAMNKHSDGLTADRRAWSRQVRGIHLLQDEKVVGLLDGATGLTEAPTPQGPLLALTDRRVISLLDAEDRRESHVAAIDKVQGVSIRTNQRPAKPLIQGVVLILVGILVYLVVGTFSTGIPVNAGITIGALLGGAVALLGLLFILRFLFWEQGGELVFQTGGLELTFLYNTERAAPSVQRLLRRFFQLQTGLRVQPLYPHTTVPGWPPLLRMPPPPAPPPPKEAPTPPPKPEPPRRRDRKNWRRRVRPWMPALRLLRRDPASGRKDRVRTLRYRRRPLGASPPKLRKTPTQLRGLRQLARLRRHPLPNPGRNPISRRRRGLR